MNTAVGTFFHPITLISPSGASETLEALVDTGASFTSVPSAVLDRIGVRAHRTMRFRGGARPHRRAHPPGDGVGRGHGGAPVRAARGLSHDRVVPIRHGGGG